MRGSRWPECRLADVCDSVDYGYTASAKQFPAGPKFLRITDIVPGHISWDAVPFCEITEADFAKYRLNHGDVVIARTGATTGYSAYIASPPKAVFASYLVRLKVGPNADSRYVAYFLKSPEFWAYMRGVLGDKSAQPNASAKTMTQVRLNLPPLPEQEAIAHVLGTLDDKIELNRRMNETLEQMTRAIFKSWFVDFDPVRAKAEGRATGIPADLAALFPDSFQDSPLGPIPQGWQVVAFKDLCDVAIGGDWGRGEPSQGFVEVVCLRGVDLGHLRRNGAADAPRRWVKESSLAKRKLDTGDVLIAASGAGPLGRPLWVSQHLESAFPVPVIYSNFCKRITCKSTAIAVYVDCFLHELRESGEIWEYSTGTSVPNLDIHGLLNEHQLVLPCEELLQQFLAIVTLIAQRLYSRESGMLASIRDALLPKLLSGEIQIKDAERFSEARS